MVWSYLDTVLIVVISAYLFQAPFTKVEESFSIQAIHDILNYGVWNIEKYDHFQFPGAVPRSFVGPLIIAGLTKPFAAISSIFGGNAKASTQFEFQILSRCMIGLTNALSLIYLKNCAQNMFDLSAKKREEDEENRRKQGTSVKIREPEANLSTVGTWFLVFVMTGFHLVFYSSRPLPNFVVTLPLTNVAIAWILSSNYDWAIFLSAFTAVVFRLEVAALASGLALMSVIYRKISLLRAVKFGLMGLFIGMGVSLSVDSYFWGAWCVPEVDAFVFNVIKGNASKWGAESPFAYLTHYLRMLFIPPTVLLLNLLGFKMAPTNLKIISLSAYFHILVMSLQPHKEWRFIVYSLPPIILLGSTAGAYIWENIKITSVKNLLLVSIVPFSPLLSLVLSLAFLYVSSMNYPGGEALTQFNDLILSNNITNSTVHLTVPVCMTGATLFGQLDHDVYGIKYDRTENTTELEALWPDFDYLIAPEPEASLLPFSNTPADKWEVIQTSSVFSGINGSVINRFWSQEDKNVIALLKDCITSKNSLATQISDLFNDLIMREPIFFTYRRVNDE